MEAGDGLAVFIDGVVGSTGTQTSGSSHPSLVLPANKVPTDIAMSSGGEFAFVTVWDTDAVKGQVAVIVLRAPNPGAFSIPYFGLENEGGFTNMQVMGYVDLPDMATPTAIAAAGNNGVLPGGHTIGFETSDFPTNAASRATLLNDDDQSRPLASSGSLVVLSRWENKATFVDLRPLFQFVRTVYLSAPQQQALNQDVWPYDFTTNPEAKPVVLTTLAIAHPTVARVGNTGGPGPLRAWIAQLDGTLTSFDISAINEAPRPIPADSIKSLGSGQVDPNPTALHIWNGLYYFNEHVTIVSRGNRSVQWIEPMSDGIMVTRTLRDSRMNDPVDLDMNDRAALVTVADFTGKKLINYRFGPTEDNPGKLPANYGCGPNGSDAQCDNYECSGELTFPGAVFRIDTTNVN
jgi:hypothetical protein